MIEKIKYFLVLLTISIGAKAQTQLDSSLSSITYGNSKEYEIGGITVTGTDYLDKNVIILSSGLTVGDKISVPGDKITKAIHGLWELNLFSDIGISATKIQNNRIFLDIKVEERPRLSKFSFKGIKKSEADDIREKIKLIKGKIVTNNLIVTTKNTIKDFFVNKGYLDAQVNITQKPDSTQQNSLILYINIKKNNRIKIHEIIFEGNKEISSKKLKRTFKETKEKHWYSIFKASKYIEENYEADKLKIISAYNTRGYRDAKIIRDSVYRFDDKTLNIRIVIDEGKKYYFRNITWAGNTKHSTQELNNILNIKKGDVFNQETLDSRLLMNQEGRDITSLYMDDGYLFFQVTPVEVMVEKDSIDMEMRIYEGKQATINKVTVSGNTKTNDHVIMREIRTKPGQLFSRSDIIRSQRELAQLRYFDPEKLGVNPKPNPADGTVDIDYTVEEKPSDQIELSGGWGQGGIVGTLGVSFNNFSTRNFFKKGAWRPLPAGDGQTLSIRAQSSGKLYQSYNFTFVEPWLGGKKPNSFSVSGFHTIYAQTSTAEEGKKFMNITGLSLGLGKRLQVPDDYFTLYQELTFQHYLLHNYQGIFIFDKGQSNNFNYKLTFSRNSIDAPIFPRSGSQISLSLQITPPYSLFRKDSIGNTFKDYSTLAPQEKYKFVEYHKWKFSSSWFNRLIGDLVLNTKIGFGFLGDYNNNLGYSPFERFYLGGDGLSSGLGGFVFDGREIIALRGYADQALSPKTGATAISKYVMELRYPVSLNPSATIYGLAFAEAGNSWGTLKEFNPFQVKRSAGVGVRIFLPMFGLLGFDYGWGLDKIPNNPGTGNGKGQFHFTIGANLGDL